VTDKCTIDRIQTLIEGVWQRGDGEPLAVTSPSSGQQVAAGCASSADQVGQAVNAASAVFPELARISAFERAKLCHGVAAALRRRIEPMAHDLALEQGKPLAEATIEIEVAAEMFEAAAEDGKRLNGEILPSADTSRQILVTHVPLGVVAVITPWNFPVTIPSEYLSACLTLGNTVVWKPASTTPVSALHLAECFAEAGVPAGALNVVFGSGSNLGPHLASHPRIDAVGLTGSSESGEAVAQVAGTRRLLLELGGNGPAILAEDADLTRAIPRLAVGCFANAGQICDSTERILVHRSLVNDVINGLREEVDRITLGRSLDDGVTMGPLNNEPTAAKVDLHLRDAVAGGARVIAGGGRATGWPSSLYYEPTIVTDVSPTMLINREETFGPVAALIAFDSDDEAIAVANDTDLGLVAGVFTRDISRANRYASALRAGIVNINETPTYWQPHTPFGGFAGTRSGVGRLGGPYTLRELSQTKAVVVDVS
jgi:succinate-semialdehyde dehydrogenase/glutarate-semialdehyde dehydrogenase